jgi:DNA-binding IclR family transcriptional regulator
MVRPIKIAVFPVAGLGTRFLPATKAMPKEMLTVVDRPVVQLAVDEARERGWAIVDEELELGLRSLSVPLRGRGGVTVGALNICGPTSRVSLEELRTQFLGELLGASARIQAALD